MPLDPTLNPLSLLTFIAAPAVLTNASSVMALGTSNRFARAIDRTRTLAAQVYAKPQGTDAEAELHRRQLRVAERRAQLLVRALTAFYLAVGSFAASSLVSLIGAMFFLAHLEFLHLAALAAAFLAGVTGVGGVVAGSGLLVLESRLTLRILQEETEFHLQQRAQQSPGERV
ncbi:MAG TPA: DUF2721 domain-containing protein [Pirellulales bacterium]|jgi:hypothetical protein|nr:DUF2721 domain-containing protein [Pirellulales bacterium]